MKKKLLLIICILLITGCKVEYNLIINDNVNIEEQVLMTGTDEFFEVYYKSSKLNIVNMIFDSERKELLSKNNYNYQVIEDNTPYVKATKKYNNIKDYTNNSIFIKPYFENVNVNEIDGIITLNINNYMPVSPDEIERFYISGCVINIKLDYQVIESNAMKYDKKTNTYSWYINEETDNFNIKLSYDTNKIYEEKKQGINYELILWTLLILLIVIIVLYIVNKKKYSKKY